MRGSINHETEFSTHQGGVECLVMIEESPETFIAKWREFGVSAELFPRTEGSPLIEALVGGVIFQLFERTGPYLARSGAAHLIVHPVTKKMVLHGGEGHEPGIEITGISSFDAKGTVLKVEGQVVVVDAGLPLVVGLLGPHEEAFQVGSGSRSPTVRQRTASC